MADATTTTSDVGKRRYAVVTGANKGIGLEICRQLASKGVIVVLTARDEKRGIEALEKLKGSSSSSDGDNHLIFHKLDVTDPSSISTLFDFIKNQFGKLDILVNNAGISGTIMDEEAFKAVAADVSVPGKIDWEKIVIGEQAEECIQTNYYGAKRMTEAFIPLLQLSDSPRIVNVSSSMGKLKNIPNEWAKRVLSDDAESLTEEKVDQVLNEFLKDSKEGSAQAKGWPSILASYTVSKAAMNAYTRIIAKKYPKFVVNCVCPGYVKTDINFNTGVLSVEEGGESVVRLALLPDGSPSGLFFVRGEISSFE